MRLNFFIIIFALLSFLNAPAQLDNDTLIQRFANDMKKLVELNSHTPYGINFSLKEAVDIQTNATTEQIIEITTPYLNSNVLNAKNISFRLLADVLLKKEKDQSRREQIIEIICRNYLDNREDIQMVDNVLLMQKEKDFNNNAKKYISSLKDSLSRSRLPNDVCAKLLGIAQIKESIPFLWKIANRNITTIERYDVDILASLARLNEKEAGSILCDYYTSKIDRNDKYYRYIVISKNMAFAIDSSILMLLIKELKILGPNAGFREYDTGFNASQYLGFSIASMLKNYPYSKDDYNLKPQLLDWSNQTANYELAEK